MSGGEVERARLDIRVLDRHGKLEFLDLRVYHPCSAKGKCTAAHRPEHHERGKNRRYPTQGENGQRLHPFTFSPIVFSSLGGISSGSYKTLQRLVKSGPLSKRGEISPGDIVQAAAVKVVRMSALLKREAWLGSLRRPPKPRRELAAELEPTPPPTEHPLPALYRDWLEKHPRGGTAPRRD